MSTDKKVYCKESGCKMPGLVLNPVSGDLCCGFHSVGTYCRECRSFVYNAVMECFWCSGKFERSPDAFRKERKEGEEEGKKPEEDLRDLVDQVEEDCRWFGEESETDEGDNTEEEEAEEEEAEEAEEEEEEAEEEEEDQE